MKPKILSMKLGYNPNSSSLAMGVRIFLWSSFVINILFGIIGGLIKAKKKKP